MLTRWREGEQGVRSYLREIEAICGEMLAASKAGRLSARRLGQATCRAQAAIGDHLRISNPQIDGWASTALAAGAFGAKSCGARLSGGAVVAVCDETTIEAVADALARAGAFVLTSRPWQARADQAVR